MTRSVVEDAIGPALGDEAGEEAHEGVRLAGREGEGGALLASAVAEGEVAAALELEEGDVSASDGDGEGGRPSRAGGHGDRAERSLLAAFGFVRGVAGGVFAHEVSK